MRKPIADDRPEDEEIQDQDREPARKSVWPDRQQSLPLDETDDRTEPNREQAADVDEEQDAANLVGGPQQDDGQAPSCQIVQRISRFWSASAVTRRLSTGQELTSETGDVVVDTLEL